MPQGAVLVYHMPMRKKCIPFALAKSIYEIDPEFFLNQGVKTVLTDLDNTLEPYDVKHPTPRTKELAERLKERGIDLYIASNSHGARVGEFASYMGVESVCFLGKPFSGKLRKFLRKNGIEPSSAVLIGDQIQTDVKAANGAKIRAILTEPFNLNEPPWTKFNRLFEKGKRKKVVGGKLAPDWKEIK